MPHTRRIAVTLSADTLAILAAEGIEAQTAIVAVGRAIDAAYPRDVVSVTPGLETVARVSRRDPMDYEPADDDVPAEVSDIITQTCDTLMDRAFF